jgi:hypothetical protein
MYKFGTKKHAIVYSIITSLLSLSLLLLLNLNTTYQDAVALSPSFGLQEITNEKDQWVQTYGNNASGLKSNYTDLLAVNYLSNGKSLNSTIWLASGFKNSSVPVYDQPFRSITYGMLIDADSNPQTGYNGADYDFYVEATGGKLNGYLYQLSSTGAYRLVGSKIDLTQPLLDPDALRGSITLQLDLSSINYPSKYNLLFYSAESFRSNEVRQFTSWVSVPPPTLLITTSPSNVMIRQGQEQTIPARIKSTTGFSNDVINISLSAYNNDNLFAASGFNSSDLHVAVEDNQPPLFRVAVPQQTSLGIYTIPLIVTIREPSTATLTKPISMNTTHGAINPEFELSKKYPTVGYLTKPVNFTVTVVEPTSINEQFKDFWVTYGTPLAILTGGIVGAFSTFFIDYLRNKRERKQESHR